MLETRTLHPPGRVHPRRRSSGWRDQVRRTAKSESFLATRGRIVERRELSAEFAFQHIPPRGLCGFLPHRSIPKDMQKRFCM